MPLDIVNGGQVGGAAMPTHKQLHLMKANSIDARISTKTPRTANLNLMLSNGDFWSVEIPRHVLVRLGDRIQRALDGAPLPARGKSGGGQPANGQNK
jgi:hypothetical protein